MKLNIQGAIQATSTQPVERVFTTALIETLAGRGIRQIEKVQHVDNSTYPQYPRGNGADNNPPQGFRLAIRAASPAVAKSLPAPQTQTGDMQRDTKQAGAAAAPTGFSLQINRRAPEITQAQADKLIRQSMHIADEASIIPPLTQEMEAAFLNAAKDFGNQLEYVTKNDGSKRFLAEQAILFLAGRCDGAASLDGIGFNGRDTAYGKSLAAQMDEGKRLSSKQLEAAYKVIQTYRYTQLGWIDWNAMQLEESVVKQKIADGTLAPLKPKDDWDAINAYPMNKVLHFFSKLTREDIAKRIEQRDRTFALSLLEHFWRTKTFTHGQEKWVKKIARQYESLVPDMPAPQETVRALDGTQVPFKMEIASGSRPEDTGLSGQKQIPGADGAIAKLAADQRAAAEAKAQAEKPTADFNSITGATAQPTGGFKLRLPGNDTTPASDGNRNPSVPAQLAAKVASLHPEAAKIAEEQKLPVTPAQAVKHHTMLQAIKSDTRSEEILEPTSRKVSFMRGGKMVEILPDESQLQAIDNLGVQQFGCLTGAAGTGKTTIERMLVSQIEETAPKIKIVYYGRPPAQTDDPDYDQGEQQREEKVFPSVAFCAYTGKAMQQQKRALPESYHARCFTIHGILGFYPIFEEIMVTEGGKNLLKTRRKFVPWYTRENKMPWRVLFIDEASMVPIQLWNQLLEACREDCRIYLIGDINQLPPVHGRSVFGFAMLAWPSFELKHIHRQKGEDNPIVDNAWRILQGMYPKNVPGRFDMIRVDNTEKMAEDTLIKVARALQLKGEFDPVDKDDRRGDMVIVAQNKDPIGQFTVNQRLLKFFNPPPPHGSVETLGKREVVIAGYERKTYAEGDKVMATVNDHENGVTNGMTGRIVSIARNGHYSGPGGSFNLTVADIDKLMSGEFDLTPPDEAKEQAKDESFNKRAASHIISVDFGIKEDGSRAVVDFDTTGGVNSLQHAYAATCHKLQGSECPTAIILCHSKQHKMLYREWLYTAVTRAIHRVILIYNDKGLEHAVNRQRIKGSNLKEKAQAFVALQEKEDTQVPELPAARRWAR